MVSLQSPAIGQRLNTENKSIRANALIFYIGSTGYSSQLVQTGTCERPERICLLKPRAFSP